MGYAGYVPAKAPPPKPSDVQAALWAVTSMESLEIIGTLLRNLAVSPKEEKYRKIKLTNKKLKAALVDTPGALQAMLAFGWTHEDTNTEVLIVPQGCHVNMTEVRAVEDAKDRLKKAARHSSRTASALRLPVDTEKAKIRAQMEADRAERSAAANSPLPTAPQLQ